MLVYFLAVMDAAAGIYLVRYALTRERRDKDGVLAVGYFLVCCGIILVALEVTLDGGRLPAPPGRSTLL